MNQDQRAINLLNNTSFINRSLALICARSPVVKRTLDNYGEASLTDYLRQILSISKNPLQSRNDLLEVVYRYTVPLLGKKVAEKAVQDLAALPAVLTANHHGVDFLAQSVQGSLIFSLREVGGKPAKTVPIFACGSVAMNNPTYPRGLLLYAADHRAAGIRLPIRLPIFSDRHKRKSVSVVNAFGPEMLAKAQRSLSTLMKDRQLNPTLAATVATILSQDYQDETVIGLKDYSQQAVILNNRIWKRCFREPEQAPELVYLELEKITSLLLQRDLINEDSLIWQVMFNPGLRAEVLSQLDGVKSCWDQSKLAGRASQKLGDKYTLPGGSGTVFFWAVDITGWRIPLLLMDRPNHTPALQGWDERGKLWTIPFTPKDILDGLQAGWLLPSLFTCYSTIGFARGVSCCGGYFQAEYLVSMQNGLIKALQESTGCTMFAEYLSQVPSDIYLSGMQTVMRKQGDDLLLPVGPIEMIANGGLSSNQLERVCSLTVQDAHLAGLMETLSDFQSCEDRPDDWCMILARESSQLLKDRVVLV